jgi:hypothetical protein
MECDGLPGVRTGGSYICSLFAGLYSSLLASLAREPVEPYRHVTSNGHFRRLLPAPKRQALILAPQFRIELGGALSRFHQ